MTLPAIPPGVRLEWTDTGPVVIAPAGMSEAERNRAAGIALGHHRLAAWSEGLCWCCGKRPGPFGRCPTTRLHHTILDAHSDRPRLETVRAVRWMTREAVAYWEARHEADGA